MFGLMGAVNAATGKYLVGWGMDASGASGTLAFTLTDPSNARLNPLNWSTTITDGFNTFALTSTGTLYGCGANIAYTLGTGDSAPYTEFTRIGEPNEWRQVAMSPRNSFCAGVKKDGTLHVWGMDLGGWAGRGHPGFVTNFVPTGLYGRIVSTDHTLVVLAPDGDVYAAGYLPWYSGLDGVNFSSEPLKITDFGDIIDASANRSGMLFIRSDGTLWGIGENNAGELGLGNAALVQTPTQVGVDTDWTALVTLGRFQTFDSSTATSVAIKQDGTLWMAGYNVIGREFYDQDIYRTFQQVGAEADWVDVTANTGGIAVKKTDGTLWVVGYESAWTNSMLQPTPRRAPMYDDYETISGDRFTTNTYVRVMSRSTGLYLYCNGRTNATIPGIAGFDYTDGPEQIGTIQGWIDLSMGERYVLGIAGTVGNLGLYAWGQNNAQGRLGTGDTSARNSPTLLSTGFTDWAQVQATTGSSFALRANGTLYSWGVNTSGQLGLGDTTARNVPTAVAGSWVKVSASPYNTYAISTGGALYACGINNVGQLGNGSTSPSFSSSFVQVGSRTDWTDIAAGSTFAVGIAGGELYSWGLNNYGQLGQPVGPTYYSPTQVGSASNWVAVYATEVNTYAVNSAGELFTCGRCDQGLTGVYPVPTSTAIQSSLFQIPDVVVDGPIYPTATSVIFKDVAGKAYTWGLAPPAFSEYSGDLGYRINAPGILWKLGYDTDWEKCTVVGSDAIAAIKIDGTLWRAGNNALRSMGASSTITLPYMTEYEGIDTGWEDFRASSLRGVGVCDGKLYTSGYGRNGVLGNGSTSNTTDFVQIGSDTDWVSVGPNTGNTYNTYAVKTDGSIYVTGANAEAGLIQPDNYLYKTPTQVGTDTDWESVHLGAESMMARKHDGTVWVAGTILSAPNTSTDRIAGELGLGSGVLVASSLTELEAPGASWDAISPASSNAFGISDGALYGWGENYLSTLGTGNNTPQPTPIQIGSDTDWRRITAGSASSYNLGSTRTHTFAIKDDGSLYAWGDNTSGQLGLGDETDRNTPTQVGVDADWEFVGPHTGSFTLALKEDGTLWGTGFLPVATNSNEFQLLNDGVTWDNVSYGNTLIMGVRKTPGVFVEPPGVFEGETLMTVGGGPDWGGIYGYYAPSLGASLGSLDPNFLGGIEIAAIVWDGSSLQVAVFAPMAKDGFREITLDGAPFVLTSTATYAQAGAITVWIWPMPDAPWGEGEEITVGFWQ